jgi:hypothetical protein
MKRRLTQIFFTAALAAAPVLAQVTPAAGSTPPDDTPKVNVGATIFADYTYQDSPETKDSDGNSIHASAFNVSRAYINIIGSLNHYLAFRVTPDIARETGTGSSLNGSLDFRLKYGYGQLNLDDWTTHGSWVRFGIHQTPFVDYTESIYRYRFQGTIFEERIGLISSSDAGVSGHWNVPGNYGDVQAGFFNGENYNHVETNNEKGFMIRGTVRPLPLGGALLKGLRVTGFVVEDHYVQGAPRQRAIGQVTYEHPLVNAGLDVLRAKDQTSTTKAALKSKGWSAWVTPKLGATGWEALLRHDNFVPNDAVSSQKQKRDIDGIAYWFPHMGAGKAVALLLDRDTLKRTGLTPPAPNATNYELKMLVNF